MQLATEREPIELEFRLIRPLVYVTEDITTAFAQYLGAPLVPCDCSLRTVSPW